MSTNLARLDQRPTALALPDLSKLGRFERAILTALVRHLSGSSLYAVPWQGDLCGVFPVNSRRVVDSVHAMFRAKVLESSHLGGIRPTPGASIALSVERGRALARAAGAMVGSGLDACIRRVDEAESFEVLQMACHAEELRSRPRQILIQRIRKRLSLMSSPDGDIVLVPPPPKEGGSL